MSKAENGFKTSVSDVKHLMEFHEEVGGTAPGKREYRLQSLNKSAVVLLCAAWESYVEDVIRECADVAIGKAKLASDLPKALQGLIVKTIEADKHELAMLSLAGEGWRDRAKSAVESVVAPFNTPKAQRVATLFKTVLGVADIHKGWSWHKNQNGEPATRLDEFVELRGAIAHGGVTGGSVNKIQVTQALDLIERIIATVETRLKNDALL